MFGGRGPGLPVGSLGVPLRLPVLLALGWALAQTGCASGGTQRPLAAAPGQSLEHLDAGRVLFAGHCQSCHTLPEPGELAPAAWPPKVALMARKSGLSTLQIALVSDYLVAASRDVR